MYCVQYEDIVGPTSPPPGYLHSGNSSSAIAAEIAAIASSGVGSPVGSQAPVGPLPPPPPLQLPLVPASRGGGGGVYPHSPPFDYNYFPGGLHYTWRSS